ncbi:hypothetical protein AB685_10615 [Bacillus sp. LL01]|uniref:hypothetical protein n=1 Tax=Bacillus sp. LL01 TaxID=1665556 RepID=UPI00064D0E6F|nr:hypothetical protein [Bacillus sp. LL01]KMJ58345.1 hypothetical protein AB685_10615 [Bacillus sp. LL01]
MKVKIGIIGPTDSIERIKYVGKEFESVDLLSFSYTSLEEIDQIIYMNKGAVDQWMFSGQVPFSYARSKELINKSEGSYAELYGSSFLGTLLEAQMKEKKIFENISIDTIKQSRIDMNRDFFSLQAINFHSYAYDGFVPTGDLVKYHQELYEEGKIEVAFTCIQSVSVKLKEMGIPCYRIIPSDLAILSTLEVLIERAHSLRYRKSQIAILGVEVIHTATSLEEMHYSHKMKIKELELRRLMLRFAEEVNGSFVQFGDGLFLLFTTRGELELHIEGDSLLQLIEDINMQSNLKVRLGLGFGETVLAAEENVRQAFHHAREKKTSSLVCVNEDRDVTEFFNTKDKLSFQSRSLGQEWEAKLKDVNISPTIVSKIKSLAQYYQKDVITSQDLASWLKSTERNARRILTELERSGLVRVSGEEQSGHRGRPRKIYTLSFL